MTQTPIAPEKPLNIRPSLLTRHPLVSYFVLAYAIAWLLWLPLVLSKGGGIGLIPFTTDATVDGIITLSWIILGSLGPALAAVIMAAMTEGKAGVGLLLRRIVRARVGFQWYLVALFFPLLPVIIVLFISGLSAQMLSWRGVPALLLYAITALISMVLGTPLGEEIGWRGFALPKLQQRMGPFKSSLLLGTLWGFWHAPLAFFTVWGKFYELTGLVPGLLLFLLAVISYSVAMTWVFNHTRGSIFLAILFHSAIDSRVVIVAVLLSTSAASLNASNTGSGSSLLFGLALYVAVWALIAGIVFLATRGKLSYKPSIEAELQSEQLDNIAP